MGPLILFCQNKYKFQKNSQAYTCKSVNTGRGQRTILGPLIFIFYINDVIKCTSDLRVNMRMIVLSILFFLFIFCLDSMFISVEDRTGRIRFSYNYSMYFTHSQ